MIFQTHLKTLEYDLIEHLLLTQIQKFFLGFNFCDYVKIYIINSVPKKGSIITSIMKFIRSGWGYLGLILAIFKCRIVYRFNRTCRVQSYYVYLAPYLSPIKRKYVLLQTPPTLVRGRASFS